MCRLVSLHATRSLEMKNTLFFLLAKLKSAPLKNILISC